MMRDLTFKISIIGEKSAGKSSLIQAATRRGFNEDLKPPAIIEIAAKNVTIDSFEVMLQIWILRFDLQFDFFFPIFLRGTSGGIFLYDITKFSSIHNVKRWITIFQESLGNDMKKIPLIMVGGKCDLYYKRTVPEKYAEGISQKYKFDRFLECSAKTGENIEQLFIFITRSILKFKGYL